MKNLRSMAVSVFLLAGAGQIIAAGLENQWMFAAGGSSSFAISPANALIGWGQNNSGQLGLGDNNNRTSPTPVYGPSTWRQVDVSKTHGIAIQDGKFWSWGTNTYGQLGDGTTNSSNVAGYSSPDGNWLSVCVGIDHSAGLKANGDVYTWGRNNYGQLGLGAASNAIYNSPTRIPNYSFKAISCGDNYTVGIRPDGTLWAWGYNGYGNLGDNTTTNRFSPVQVGLSNGTSSNWIAVSAGGGHTVGLRCAGAKAYAWGKNTNGQLGDNSTTNRWAPKLIAMPQSNHIVEISAGGSHTLAVTVSGGLWAWGLNSSGQLGDGTNSQRNVPVRIPTDVHNWLAVDAGDAHSLGIRVDGTLMSWGNNGSGQLGRATNITPTNRPGGVLSSMRLGNMATAISSNVYLLRSNGELWDWGQNSNFALGRPRNVDNYVPNKVRVTSPMSDSNGWVKLAEKGNSMMAGIKAGGSLWTWGMEMNGELGNGGSFSDILSVPTRIGTSADTLWRNVSCTQSCMAVKSDGTLWAWGSGYLGNLPTQSVASTPIPVGTGNSWVSVSMGNNFTAAIQADGSIWTWGDNTYGQLGQNNYSVYPTPTRVAITDLPWKAVECGTTHLLALNGSGSVYAVGDNTEGQLGIGSANTGSYPYITSVALPGSNSYRQISAGYINSMAVDAASNLYTWGANFDGQMGWGWAGGINPTPYLVTNARVGIVGNEASFSLDNYIYGWGYGRSGQLGDGSLSDYYYPNYIMQP